jgi:hypothetical protein
MFCALADAKGEEGFKSEPSILRILNSMCIDTNWKIRKQGAQFLFGYLKTAHNLKKKSKKHKEAEEEKVNLLQLQ